MSKKLQTAAIALGLTTICMTWLIGPLVSSEHHIVYHWSGSASLLFGTAFLDLFIVWAILMLLLVPAEKAGWLRTIIWLGILLYVPWLAVRVLNLLLWPKHLIPGVVTGWAILAWDGLVVILALGKKLELLIEFSSTVLMFVAISGLFGMTEMAWLWWSARSLNKPLPVHRAQRTIDANPKPRIVWIVLDELSYQQVYERRYPGLELPAFDALAKQATVFTHTVPAGIFTEMVLPALITGKPIDDVRSSRNGSLWMHNGITQRWEPFEQQDTVFQDALNAGYETAVAGWYNPYCRLMPSVLAECYATWGYESRIGMSSYGRSWFNPRGSFDPLLSSIPWCGRLCEEVAERRDIPNPIRSGDLTDYEKIASAGDKMLRNPAMNFVLLHLPIPHPPGIYDRRAGHLTTGPATYIDNLALADRYLARVRSVLESSGQWDSSTVIVMGDHSWRTQLEWKDSSWWTKEAQQASDGGRFDDRPAYIVKLAGQHDGVRVDATFRALETHDLLDVLIAGRIHSANDLQAWVQRTGSQKDTIATSR